MTDFHLVFKLLALSFIQQIYMYIYVYIYLPVTLVYIYQSKQTHYGTGFESQNVILTNLGFGFADHEGFFSHNFVLTINEPCAFGPDNLTSL